MKVLLLDIETAPNVVMSWGLFKQNIAINQIMAPGYTLCWAAKWLGPNADIEFSSIKQDGEKKMLRRIHKLLDEADVVIHYNGKSFDVPTLNKEFVRHNMRPPSPYKQVDLLQVARQQFRFTSNKLDYVAQFLGLGMKIQHKGMDLWRDCMAGNADAWAKMEEYNIGDVTLLEKMYQRLLPWIPGHPNPALYEETDVPVCPNCGSTHLRREGYAYTQVGKYPRHSCNECGKWSRGRYTVLPKEARKALLVGA